MRSVANLSPLHVTLLALNLARQIVAPPPPNPNYPLSTQSTSCSIAVTSNPVAEATQDPSNGDYYFPVTNTDPFAFSFITQNCDPGSYGYLQVIYPAGSTQGDGSGQQFCGYFPLGGPNQGILEDISCAGLIQGTMTAGDYTINVVISTQQFGSYSPTITITHTPPTTTPATGNGNSANTDDSCTVIFQNFNGADITETNSPGANYAAYYAPDSPTVFSVEVGSAEIDPNTGAGTYQACPPAPAAPAEAPCYLASPSGSYSFCGYATMSGASNTVSCPGIIEGTMATGDWTFYCYPNANQAIVVSTVLQVTHTPFPRSTTYRSRNRRRAVLEEMLQTQQEVKFFGSQDDNDLFSCGSSKKDCSQLAGVHSVACEFGTCVIGACEAGWSLTKSRAHCRRRK